MIQLGQNWIISNANSYDFGPLLSTSNQGNIESRRLEAFVDLYSADN
jgi:hypothetical protein